MLNLPSTTRARVQIALFDSLALHDAADCERANYIKAIVGDNAAETLMLSEAISAKVDEFLSENGCENARVSVRELFGVYSRGDVVTACKIAGLFERDGHLATAPAAKEYWPVVTIPADVLETWAAT